MKFVERRPRVVLLTAALIAAAAFVLTSTGVVPLPDWEEILTDISDTLGTWSYVLVGGLAFLETGAFVGLVAPGETAVVLGGVIAAHGDVSIVAMLLVVWWSAAAGDFVSFLLGRRLGRPFIVRRGPSFGVTHERLDRVERFFDRHGPKAILVGRFIGIIRALAPFLAGASGMKVRAFLPWSLLGTLAWASTFTLVGYAFSESFSSAAELTTRGALALAVVVALALAWQAHRRQRRVALSEA